MKKNKIQLFIRGSLNIVDNFGNHWAHHTLSLKTDRFNVVLVRPVNNQFVKGQEAEFFYQEGILDMCYTGLRLQIIDTVEVSAISECLKVDSPLIDAGEISWEKGQTKITVCFDLDLNDHFFTIINGRVHECVITELIYRKTKDSVPQKYCIFRYTAFSTGQELFDTLNGSTTYYKTKEEAFKNLPVH